MFLANFCRRNVVAMATTKVYLSSFDFKTSPIYFKDSHKVSKTNLLSFRRYAPKTSGGGSKNNRVKRENQTQAGGGQLFFFQNIDCASDRK